MELLAYRLLWRVKMGLLVCVPFLELINDFYWRWRWRVSFAILNGRSNFQFAFRAPNIMLYQL